MHSLQLKKFHLLGHSFGGIIAYEYAKAHAQDSGEECISLTLNSTPSSMKMSLEECSRLEEEVRSELKLTLQDMNEEEATRLVHDVLRRRTECRLEELPDALVTAIKYRGTTFGAEDVASYLASPPCPPSSLPPVLMIRGQHDFITDKCIEGWREICNQDPNTKKGIVYREEVMINCSHYCHLEDARSFGDLIKSHCFINDY